MSILLYERKLFLLIRIQVSFLFGYVLYKLVIAQRGVSRSIFGTGGLIIADIINLDESGVRARKMKVGWMGVGGRKGDRWLLGDVSRRSVRGQGEGSWRLPASAIDAALCLRSPCLQRTVWRDVSVPDNLITSQHSTPSCATVSRALPCPCSRLINHLSSRLPSLSPPLLGIQSSRAPRHPLTDVSSDETVAHECIILRALDRLHSKFRDVIISSLCLPKYVCRTSILNAEVIIENARRTRHALNTKLYKCDEKGTAYSSINYNVCINDNNNNKLKYQIFACNLNVCHFEKLLFN